ncbi:hypothetical protein [Nocardioides currus]|uniref:Uncharacterized protein n=1 Tax=Nocardioides currus TaxID=2133958 RepID=A0A2R7YV64_9ACTN|nr:hypothetical protein [Nocardioides currus]PUA79769.1 hypothetical protein C7S10_16945 [Nocardioides currus]
MSDEVRRAAQESRLGYAELHAELAMARAELDAARAQPMFTQEEKEQLQEVARSGAMGRDMQEFAEDVRRGDADWESFIRGQDGRTALLEGFVDTAQEEFGEEAEAAFAESEAPDDVEDPRR